MFQKELTLIKQVHQNNVHQFKIVEALVVSITSKPVKNQFLKDVQKHYTHLAGVQLSASNSTNSDMNIGRCSHCCRLLLIVYDWKS